MMNYHEMTMNEPRDSPQRRKQFLVVSFIMVVIALHAGLTAGLLAPLDIETGTFPGGEFVYKLMVKDYAASTGTLRTVASDLGIVEEGSGNLILSEGVELDTADLLYSMLLDDERLIPGGQTRFAAGLLARGREGNKMKRQLLEVNGLITGEGTHSKDIKYEVGKLPKAEAAVVQHPFTAGAWSAILQSYKILPKFKKYADRHGQAGESAIIIATCSAKQQMCTYYMPLSKHDKFYMGHPTTAKYAEQFAGAGTLERWGIVFDGGGFSLGGVNFGNVVRGLKRAVGLGGSRKGASEEL
ncbi:hypothetical protein ACHAXT_009070 [Thalassiosira profunda]